MPQHDTSVVLLEGVPPASGVESTRFPVRGVDHVRTDHDTMAVLRNLGDGQLLSVLQLQGTVGSSTFAALVTLGLEGFDRLESVHRLLASLHERAIPPDTRLTVQQRLRLRRMLQAFDGRRDGATQKEIGETIFRTGHLSRHDWQAHSARHAVMALLKDARSMVEGGYLQLLRHKRRE